MGKLIHLLGHTVSGQDKCRTNVTPVSVCPHRCKFFSLTETPEDYTIIVDEEGFLGECFSHWGCGQTVPCHPGQPPASLFLSPAHTPQSFLLPQSPPSLPGACPGRP